MIGKIPVKKLALIVLAVLLSAAVLDLLWWFISPGEAVVNQPGDVFKLNLAEATPVNCVFDASGHHIPANSDPQLVFSLPQEEEIKSVTVRLQQPLRRKGYVQVYYGIDEITEINSVGFSAKAGTREFYFNLPGDKYAFLRLDINADCWLDSVSCSDQPASFLRIPPFRPLRILAVAVMLGLAVFFFSRTKVRKCVRTLDHDWINPETRKPIVTVLYAVFAMAMLLHHIVVTLWYPGISKGTDIKYLRILFPFFAFVSIPLGHMWKDKGFWFLAALVVLQYLRLAIPTPVVATDFASVLYAFFGCYSVAMALGTKAQKPFLKVFCAVWITAVTVLCLFGLYSAWTGNDIHNFSDGIITTSPPALVSHRLQLFYFTGTSGIFISASIAFLLISCTLSKKKFVYFLFIAAFLILFTASSLTVSRTSFLMTGISIGLILCVYLHGRIVLKKTKWPSLLAGGKMLLLLFSFFFVAFTLVYIQSIVPDLFSNFRMNKGLIITNAMAEDNVPEIIHRNIINSSDLNSISTGRVKLWKNVLDIIFSDSSNLIWGQSIHQPMNIINTSKAHCHNLWIQTLLQDGLPGLFLMISLHVNFFIHSCRLMKCKGLAFWQRIIAVPAISVLVSEILEHTAGVDACNPQTTLLFLCIGFTVTCSQYNRKNMTLH